MIYIQSAIRRLSPVLLLLLLGGCAWLQSEKGVIDHEPQVRTTGAIAVDPEDNSQTFGIGLSNENNQDNASSKPDLFAGTDKLLNLPPVRPAIELEGESVMLNFQKTPLEDVVHGVLGDILGLDYIIEKPIPGEVTLRTQSPLPRDQLLSIVESMLLANNLTMVRSEGDTYVISTRDGLSNHRLSYANPQNRGAGFSHVIVPLEHIGANEMAEILRPVATDKAFVRVDTVRNLLILAGTRAQLDGWLEIVETFDVDLLSGMSVAIFPINYSDVMEVTTALEPLLGGVTGEGEGALTGLVRLIPLENLGSILVVTPKKSYLEKVREWIQRLDKAPELGAEPQLFVYSVQNGTASYLASLLSNVFGGTSSSSIRGPRGSQANQGVSPGLTPSNLSSGGSSDSRDTVGSSQNNTNSRQGASSFELGDSIRVVADEVNNSLLIHATGNEYRKIQSALEKLDVMPLQVLIEATILEVTLDDSLQYGLEWYLDNSLGNGWRGEGQLQIGDDIGISAPGFGFAFNNPLGELRAVLNTLATKNLLNVVSTPSIMVLDNHSAAIHVGNQQPIQTSSTIIEGGGVSQSISYRDTGVKLDVTPSVNAGGLVTMDLKQSVTDVGAEADASTGQVPFFERTIASRVAVRSGESVVLGGLISDSRRRGKSGLPFFQDLPLIGSLFGSTNISESRTELLVIITPHVVKTDNELRDLTTEMRSRMKGLRIFEDVVPPHVIEAEDENSNL